MINSDRAQIPVLTRATASSGIRSPARRLHTEWETEHSQGDEIQPGSLRTDESPPVNPLTRQSDAQWAPTAGAVAARSDAPDHVRDQFAQFAPQGTATDIAIGASTATGSISIAPVALLGGSAYFALESHRRSKPPDASGEALKQALEPLRPSTPDLSIKPPTLASSITLVASFGATGEAATRSAAAGDTLKVALYRNNTLLAETSETLDDNDIRSGEIALSLPNLYTVDDLRIEAYLLAPSGSISGVDGEELDLTPFQPTQADSEPGSNSPPGSSNSSTTPPVQPLPSKVSGRNFSFQDALTSAVASNLAYESYEVIVPSIRRLGWEPLDAASLQSSYLKADNAIAFAARHDAVNTNTTQFLLAFKGTSALADWGNNLARFGWTHYYQALMPLVARVIDAALSAEHAGREVELLITGHSLGGAAATLAFADMFLAPEKDFWRVTGAPLGRAERIYQHPLIDAKWTDAEIASLIDNTSTYTFGAPSFLIDPNKLEATLPDFLRRAELALVSGLKAILIDAMTVRLDQVPALEGYADRVFQFEHINSDPWRSDDIVAQLGDRDPGTVLPVNLDTPIYERYGNEVLFGLTSVTTPIDLHSMEAYIESVGRLITGAPLIKPNNPLAADAPLLNAAQSPTPFNDFLMLDEVDALGGNDIMVASEAKAYRFNGGAGDDIYVVTSFGATVTLDAPILDLDSLYFALPGVISAADRIDSVTQRLDRIFTLSHGDQQARVAVVGWDTDPQGGVNALNFVGQLQPSGGKLWSVEAPSPAVI